MKHKVWILSSGLLILLFFSSFSFKQKCFTAPFSFFQKKEDSFQINDSLRIEKDTLYRLLKKNVLASYYASRFHGKKTASGDLFDNQKLTAAHRTLPFGTLLLISNKKNNHSVLVTVNDRGPHNKSREIDLSQSAFKALANTLHQGVLKVTIEIVEPVNPENSP